MALHKVTRRDFVAAALGASAAGAGGLALGVVVGRRREAYKKRVPAREQPFAPNVYLALDDEGWVTIWVTKSEMGQGVRTALPMIIAEELCADLARVRVEQAKASLNYGDQATHSSASVTQLWDELRRAGASARQMLVAAGAQAWGVPADQCAARAHYVVHEASGRRLGFGALAQAAARQPLPEAPPLKSPAQFTIIGRPVPRLDTPPKCDGSAQFGIDVRLPGMRHATIVQAPVFGARPAEVDDTAARTIPGVLDVVPLEGGVAVVAEHSWAALRAARALRVDWQGGRAPQLDSAGVERALVAALDKKPAIARQTGDVTRVGEPTLQADYSVPYLAHACMEPLNCTAHVTPERCEVWAGSQNPYEIRTLAAAASGHDLADVVVHVPLLGGGFGRRASPDWATPAVHLSKRVGAPVQLLWSREECTQQDRYRAAVLHRVRAKLDDRGDLQAFHLTLASPSLAGMDSDAGGADRTVTMGADNFAYKTAHLRVDWVSADLPVPLGFWRAVGNSHNAFAIECAIDELASAAGRDPLDFRLALLAHDPRHTAALELAARHARWREPPPRGVFRGLATHAAYGSYAAQVLELRLDERGAPQILRVVCALDCGTVVNPDIVKAQAEGGIIFGLTAALYGRIDLADGRVLQSNFHDYPLLRQRETPEIEVHLAPSAAPPGGVGELALPPIAPALANALSRATGSRVRTLPVLQSTHSPR